MASSTDPPPPYELHSFHINIGTGDGSIHLLIDVSASSTPKTEGRVVQAIFVDGGLNREVTLERINQVIKEIERTYEFPKEDTGKLKFDSIIVTHWDSDHYEGLELWLKNGLRIGYELAGNDLTKTKIPFLRYVNDEPSTIMYAPYWVDENRKIGPCRSFQANPEMLRSGGGVTGDTDTWMKLDPSGCAEKVKKVKRDDWPKIMLLKTGAKNLLGINFLNGQRPGTNDHTKLDNPNKLTKENNPGKDRPGIYCVAVNKAVIGEDSEDTVPILKSREIKVLSEENKRTPSWATPVIDQPLDEWSIPIDKNIRSISCLVIWRDGNKCRLSHYFAGDALWELEEKIMDWTQADGPVKVTAMKLSHHGATNATPLKFLDVLDPSKIIISGGKSIKHGHPRWELLFLLHGWVLCDATQRKGCLFTTNYPFYLVRMDNGDFDYSKTQTNPGVFAKLLEPEASGRNDEYEAYEKYRDKLQEYAKTFNDLSHTTLPREDIWTAFSQDPDIKKATPGGKAKTQWMWIARKIEQLWLDIAAPGLDQRTAAVAGGAVSGPSTTVVTDNEIVLYIKVMSRISGNDGETIAVDHNYDVLGQYDGRHVTTTVDVNTDPQHTARTDIPASPPPAKIPKLDATSVISTVVVDTSNNQAGSTGTGRIILPSPRMHNAAEMATSRPAESNDTDGYYVYCSGTITSLGSSSATVLSASSPLDRLVTALHYGQMVFTTKPTASATSFLENDEWNLYFTACFDAASLSATADSNGDIDAFRLSFDFPGKGDKKLVFSSKADSILYNFGQSATIPVPGILEGPEILVFGLSPSDTAAWSEGVSMTKILKYTGLETTAPSVSGLTVKLDLQTNENRNALWFAPWSNYKAVLRLVFTGESDFLETVLKGVNGFTSIKCSKLAVIMRATHTWLRPRGGIAATRKGSVSILASCSIDVSSSKSVSFQMILDISRNSFGITLTLDSDASIELSTILSWLKSLIGMTDDFEIGDWLKTNLKIEDGSINLRRIYVTLDTRGTLSVSSVGVDLEVKWSTASSQPVVFLFSYRRLKGQKMGTFSGCLWCQPPQRLVLPHRKMLPEWEDYHDYHPETSTPANYLDIQNLFPGMNKAENIPLGMPTKIQRANVEISDAGIIFGGEIVCPAPPETTVPSISLASLELDAAYMWKGGLNLNFSVDVDLLPSQSSTVQDVARLRGNLTYEKPTWCISASIEYFRASALYSLFNKKWRDSVIPLIEGLAIRDFDIQYTYGSGGEPSSFSSDGILLLGSLELDLAFSHDINDWKFRASLGWEQSKDQPSTTLGDIIHDIMADAEIPEFVANIAVEIPRVTLAVQKSQSNNVVFSFVCSAEDFSFTFVQYCGRTSSGRTGPKRVLKLALEALPPVSIPLIGHLAQPFDEMFYMWVQDGLEMSGNTASVGLTRDEVDQINQSLGGQVLLFKNAGGNSSEDVVISPGSHFVLVEKKWNGSVQVILDHVFSASKGTPQSPSQGKQKSLSLRDRADGGDKQDQDFGFSSSMAPLNRKQGGLTISNIGLQYVPETKTLLLFLDATFVLGPISFALLGFGINIPLSSGSLRNLTSNISFFISGLGVGFDQNPIDLAGLFEVRTDDNTTIYEGGVIISLPEYEFLGAGYYGEDNEGRKSVFAFTELVGPLLSLEFAELSGVRGGFGYNSSLTLPTQENVASFPFVGASFEVKNNALQTLEQLFQSPWVKPCQGDYWAAAGLRIDALQMLFVDAVFVFQFGHDAKLGLIADLVVHIPPPASSEGRRFVFVKIGLLSTIDLNQGILLVAGQLSRESFILDPSCGLSGEFAFSYWFNPNAWAGQWVFTLGGYHHAFECPSYYPRADRLAITWNVDQNVTITGNGYFAVTPKLCMGGGMMKAEYQNGDLDLNFTAFADFLITYEPFSFLADVGVTVYGKYSPCWLITGPVSGHIDAKLHLEGPPLSGWVSVDLLGFQKTIYFGIKKPPVRSRDTLEQFYELLQADSEHRSQHHLITCETGQIPKAHKTNPTTQQGEAWLVRRGNFSFRVSSPFAFGSATCNPDSTVAWDQKIYSIPMRLSASQSIQSDLSIVIARGGEKIDKKFSMKRVINNLPGALWSAHDQHMTDRTSLLDGNRDAIVPLMVAVVLTAPAPYVPETNIPPFNIRDNMTKRILPDGKTPTFPSTAVDPYSKYWAPRPADADVGSVADTDVVKQYNDAKRAWSSPALVGGPETTFDVCKRILQWNKDVKLKTQPPRIALKEFESIYPTPPLLGLAAKG